MVRHLWQSPHTGKQKFTDYTINLQEMMQSSSDNATRREIAAWWSSNDQLQWSWQDEVDRREMRYVYHTTGPRSMKRFLSLPSNRHIVATMKYLELNDFKQAAYLTTNDKRCFDVITYESNSYFTKLHEILIPVGPGDKALPAIPMPKRLRFKCADQNATLVQ